MTNQDKVTAGITGAIVLATSGLGLLGITKTDSTPARVAVGATIVAAWTVMILRFRKR